MSESSLIVCVYVLSVFVQSSEQEGLQSHVDELQQNVHTKDRELAQAQQQLGQKVQ